MQKNMLRLVSIVGISLAMVVGFVALSSQMKDDYSVRSSVVIAIGEVIKIAGQKLNCDAPVKVPRSVAPTMESRQGETENTFSTESAVDETVSKSTDTAENFAQKTPDIFTSLEFAGTEENAVKAIGIFREVKGSSGKLRIKAGRSIELNCRCSGESTACTIVKSNINKNYLPKKIVK